MFYEIFSNDKCLGKSVRRRLDGIFQGNTPLGAITQQMLETVMIMWRCDNQYLGNA